MTAGYWLMKNSAGSSQYAIIEFEIDQQTSRAVDVVKMVIPRDYDADLAFGNDLSIVKYKDDGATWDVKFGGYLTEKNIKNELDLTIESYGGILNRTNIEEVYYTQGPEGILQQMVEGFTDLNFASTGSSGITISKFKVNNQTISWAVKEFSNLVDWTIKTDVNKNLYYAPEGETESTETLNVNNNCYMKSDWEKVPDRIINEVVFVGGVQKFNTSESYTATASQTDFPLIYSPSGNVRVTDNGTEVVGGVSGSTGTYDYTWDADTKTITFEVGRTNGHTIVIAYEYQMPVKITARNDDSVTAYGLYSKKITNNKINSMGDARNYVQTILNKYSEPGVRGTIVGPTSLGVSVGDTIQVNDTLNSISETMVIQRLKEKYPDGVYEILVGSQEWKQMDWQKETEDRLKKLEDEQDNSTLVQVYRSVNEPLIVTFNSQTYAFMREVHNAPQWNVAQWNIAYWDDERDGDTFRGYTGTAFNNIWDATGSARIASNQLKMSASAGSAQHAIYKGWNELVTMLHFDMNDNASTTTVIDSSAYNHNGTAQQNTNLLTVAGKISTALDFNGTSDTIVVADHADLDLTTAFTISLWVKPAFSTLSIGANVVIILEKMYTVTTDIPYRLDYDGITGRWRFTIKKSNVNYIAYKDDSSVVAGQWYHIVGIYNNATLRIFVDNVKGTDVSLAGGAPTTTKDLYIGSRNNASNFWLGAMDDLRIYNAVVDTAQRTAIYNSGNGTEDDRVYYSNHNGRVVIDMDKSASVGTLDFDFRIAGTGRNCYSARFDHAGSKVALVTKNAGTVSGIIGSASNTFATGSNVMYLLYQDDKIWVYKDGTFLLDVTDITYTNTGTVGFRWGGTQSGTASVSLNSFKIYKGD